MRPTIIALSTVILIGLSAPSYAQDIHVLNCRLMSKTDPWLFQQHCKSDNFARLVVPQTADDWEKPKKPKKHPYVKKHRHNKKHAYKKLKYVLLKKKYLKRKLHYLEKKLYAELRECKKNYECLLIAKRKLAKLHKHPSYNEPSAFASVGSTLGSTTNALSGAAGSLTGTAGGTLSGATNTVGGLAGSGVRTTSDTAGQTVGGATDTAGKTANGTVSGATNTVGGLLK
jgi:hypothetical protein